MIVTETLKIKLKKQRYYIMINLDLKEIAQKLHSEISILEETRFHN